MLLTGGLLVRVQPEEPISTFAPIREYVIRLNVSRRKSSAVERRVRYDCFHETRLFARIFRNGSISARTRLSSSCNSADSLSTARPRSHRSGEQTPLHALGRCLGFGLDAHSPEQCREPPFELVFGQLE